MKQETAGRRWASSGQPSRWLGSEHLCSLLTFYRRWRTRCSRRQSLVPFSLQRVGSRPKRSNGSLHTAHGRGTMRQKRAPHGRSDRDRYRTARLGKTGAYSQILTHLRVEHVNHTVMANAVLCCACGCGYVCYTFCNCLLCTKDQIRPNNLHMPYCIRGILLVL